MEMQHLNFTLVTRSLQSPVLIMYQFLRILDISMLSSGVSGRRSNRIMEKALRLQKIKTVHVVIIWCRNPEQNLNHQNMEMKHENYSKLHISHSNTAAAKPPKPCIHNVSILTNPRYMRGRQRRQRQTVESCHGVGSTWTWRGDCGHEVRASACYAAPHHGCRPVGLVCNTSNLLI